MCIFYQYIEKIKKIANIEINETLLGTYIETKKHINVLKKLYKIYNFSNNKMKHDIKIDKFDTV